jgi:peptidoglycan/LPS O-acetylase OafA/YrhL
LVRFVLAGIVVSCHLTEFSSNHILTKPSALGGLAAVIGFLVISGYSIANSIERRPQGFYRRRVLRIYPLYAGAVLFSLIPFAIAGDVTIAHSNLSMPSLRNVLINLVLLENFVGREVLSDPVVWTLAVEAVCYLAAPLLARCKTSILIVVAIPFFVAFVVYPKFNLAYYSDLRFGLPVLFLAWPWVAGFIFYRYRSSKLASVILILVCVAMVHLNQSFGAKYSELTVGVVTAIVAVAGEIPVPKQFRQTMKYLGDLSYPLYLYHLPAIGLGWVLGVRNGWLLVGGAIGVSATALAAETIGRRLFIHREIVTPSAA